MDKKAFESTQSQNLAEGLSFETGMRVEKNCQNCGFTQVRMNGLKGAYSQILIDSRPVYSALSSIYGLEQIPSNMIERIEIVRGGGSVLYGGNAIAGSINIITREPVSNKFSVNSELSLIKGKTPDRNFSFNASVVNDDLSHGLTVFGNKRNRAPFDATGDGYSELTKLNNTSFGMKGFMKPDNDQKVTLELHTLNELRRGGNDFKLQPHEADLAERLKHDIVGGSVLYENFGNNNDSKWETYASTQYINRDSYYGLDEDPNAYGTTKDLSVITGTEYTHQVDSIIGGTAEILGGG
ncbi:MAG: TonB-dependent receptor plug domain-containing protein [Flavobacteriales bacterium]